MKVGNTDFNADAVKKMKFEDFKKTYTPILKGASLEEAYTACGGVIEPEPEPEPDGDEIRET